ncbi:MAG: DNA primase [Kiritimatiellae bacterium]|nr:DNA primase [Kiritimatiellia bacterium]
MADRFESERIKENIRSAVDILDVVGSYVQLRRNGSNALALCPFHKEKTPSFHVNAARQTFHCFGCGAGGDVFKFVMLAENVDFPTALRLLGKRCGIDVPEYARGARGGGDSSPAARKDRVFAALETAERFFAEALRKREDAAEARAYLEGRDLPAAVWDRFGIGFAPPGWGFLSDRAQGPRAPFAAADLDAAGLTVTREDANRRYDRFRDRVMFAIRDELGRTVGFSGRTLKTDGSDGGKYVNSPETAVFRKSRILYGMDRARKGIAEAQCAVLCEGQIDCIRCHLAGFANVVASQGTAFTAEHARLLHRYAPRAVIVLDADAAGEKAAVRSAALLLAEEVDVAVASLPQGEDPDSLIRKDGAPAFRKALDGAESIVSFFARQLAKRHDFSSPTALRLAAGEMCELVSNAPGAVQREQMVREAAVAFGLSAEALASDVASLIRRKARFARADAPAETGGEAAAVERILAEPAGGPSAVPPAPEERALAELLLGAADAEGIAMLVREHLRYDWLTETIRPVVAALAEEEGDLLAAIEGEGEATQALAAELTNARYRIVAPGEGSREEAEARAAEDCLRKIWRRRLAGERARLTRELDRCDDAGRAGIAAELRGLQAVKGAVESPDWSLASRTMRQRLAEAP